MSYRSTSGCDRHSPGTALEQVEISPVSVTTAVSPLLLEGLHDGHSSEVHSYFTVLNGA